MKTLLARNRALVGLLLGAALAACHRDPAPETPTAASPPDMRAQDLLNPTPRQLELYYLADHIKMFHRQEEHAKQEYGAVDAGPQGSHYVEGERPEKFYPTHAAERADINRLLDSLRRTGPLLGLGRRGALLDTVEGPGDTTSTASALTPRQWAMLKLVDHIQLYHLAEGHKAKRGGVGGAPNAKYWPLPGVSIKRYPSRAAERADLNRLIDSLRVTGPLGDLGRRGSAFDTMDGLGGDAARSTNIVRTREAY